MAKITTIFICQSCGAHSPKWQGKCNECQSWNSFVEETVAKESAFTKSVRLNSRSSMSEGGGAGYATPEALHRQYDKMPALNERKSSGFSEIDRVLGGGFVPGSLLLFGGEPGIGKSTLLLQILGKLSESGVRVLYLSGEESGAQVGSRARRLGIADNDNLQFLSTTDLIEAVEAVKAHRPQVVVADSVQTLASSAIESAAGTVSQVRAVTQQFMDLSKGGGVITLLVGHVTKEGTVAGPRLLEHMVDGVFYFELATSSGYRLVRGQKNRFGATHEVAVLEMSGKGLVQIENPSARFLAERAMEMPGSAIVAHLNGSRPFMTEFQALTQKCYQGYPRRTVQGIDQNRIAVLLAVIEKSLSLSFSDQDVYCKVASGDRIEEPAADLAVLMSLVSAVEDRALPGDLLLVGEVGLGGELRSVPGVAVRLSEAKSVGVRRAIVPAWLLQEAREVKGIEIIPAKTVKEAYQHTWVKKSVRSVPQDLSH